MTERFRTPFHDYDVLAKWETPSWNEQTRGVIARRLHEIPSRRYLSLADWELVESVAHRLIPQPDRPGQPIPIVPWVDHQLYLGQGEGYRYAEVPPLREAWRRGLRGVEEDSERLHGGRFVALSPAAQDDVLEHVQRGDVTGPSWTAVPPRWFFEMVLKTMAAIYYSHPAAWSEIGFGGPASPRGYVRLGLDQRDPWEAREER